MIFDCAVIGGGPAGLNASLVLGRSRRKTVLFDDNKPRNAVVSESHGFITRDGVDPQKFKRIGHEELAKYPDVEIQKQRVLRVYKDDGLFHLEAEDGAVLQAKRIILAMGFKEILPDVKRVEEFYGKSLFSCPFCDGWEMRDKALAVISDNEAASHMVKVASNWTDDLIYCTNGRQILSEEKSLLESRGIQIYEEKIRALNGDNGKLAEILFEDGRAISREGGFITPEWTLASDIAASLGCKLNDRGGVESDAMKRTNIEGVYACGDVSLAGASQLIFAAAEGSMAAISINAAMIEEKFS
ncbi:NAD(P)/FAD-dependent oxidoreductase [Planomicrobium sp. Y74]|uniref:NAD(P)/FAD-dependent oxidoreductase n=1 Tax=Planomicrobium sp. Y74 TaxID=2478977 RepID=UPI000EF54D2D|nr:NAD(P)/FAD-dependent oxidoreductase [Planomicrobium sp. Y74]RLQ89877.1 NAD(P)/FAD-dependent oxidoreductase [Planomicrobium sp. Y74]